MENDINTDVVYINKLDNITSDNIESELSKLYGNIIRWAVIDIVDDKLKVDVTYQKREVYT